MSSDIINLFKRFATIKILEPIDEVLYKIVNKVLIDYLWSLWGKARAVYDGEEMEKYAYDRYVRMKENMKVMED